MSNWENIESLSGKDRKKIIEQTQNVIENPASLLPKKGQTSRYTNEKGESGIVANNSDLIFIEMDDIYVPSLQASRKANLLLPKITVDKGAIRFVTNGADIMRPGITNIEDGVIEGKLVVVVEETNAAPLCIGSALYDAVDMRKMDSGRVVSNLHYLSDDWWEFIP